MPQETQRRTRPARAAALWLLAVMLIAVGSTLADPGRYALRVAVKHNVIQGQYCTVPIELLRADRVTGIGAFDLLIGFDNSSMFFQDAALGPRFDSSGCGWEYFTWRLWTQPTDPYGLIKLVGLAEVNNGDRHPSCSVPDTLPATLCSMTFLVSNDRNLECQFAPIRFYWYDCTDNSLIDAANDTLFLSNAVYDGFLQTVEITDPHAGFPTFFGAQTECDTAGGAYLWTTRPAVDFINGGFDIICAEPIDATGDINLNGLQYELGDAELFINYFLQGLAAFTVNINGQIASTDVNRDGSTLAVADLVYMLRVIIGDAQPGGNSGPVWATYTVNDGIVAVDSEMGGAFLILRGNVRPDLLAADMVMEYRFDGASTRVLIHSPYGNFASRRSFSGSFLDTQGAPIVSIELATVDGSPVRLKEIPDRIQLNQNYPNPFNPKTTIRLDIPIAMDWALTVHNALGQEFLTLREHSEAGAVPIPLDCTGWPTGVYFYTLTAGSFSQTKKMILMK